MVAGRRPAAVGLLGGAAGAPLVRTAAVGGLPSHQLLGLQRDAGVGSRLQRLGDLVVWYLDSDRRHRSLLGNPKTAALSPGEAAFFVWGPNHPVSTLAGLRQGNPRQAS